jgi:DNA repair exonuclease SbcCD nuclease subunit
LKFIHAADFHLCSSFAASSLTAETALAQRKQLWDTFNKIIDTCAAEDIDILLICGDLFETSYANITDIRRAADAFGRIARTKVFIACGNHDPYTQDSYYRLIEFPKNVCFFPNKPTTIELKELDTAVCGFSWDKNRYDGAPFRLPAAGNSKINILCLHADVVTNSPYLPMQPADFAGKNYDYIALGHIHKPMQIDNKIFYSGSPEPLGFGEEGRHGYFKGEFASGKLNVNFVDCAKRQFTSITVKVTGEMDSNDIKAAIAKGCKYKPAENIYSIKFTGNVNPHISINDIIADIKDKFYFVKYTDETAMDYDIKKLYAENKNNIIGKYIFSLMEKATADPVAYRALFLGLDALIKNNEGGDRK